MAVLALNYVDAHSYVTCAASSLAATADVALFERSTDQIHWTQVRGGAAVPISSGAASVNDYEFAPGIVNYYRCSAVDLAAPSFVAAGAAATANNASVTPAVPAGYAEGDLLLIWATIRNSGAGSIVVPAGWTALQQTDNVALLGRRATASETAPTVTVAGGVTGADVIAQMVCLRNAELTPAAGAVQRNPSGQNITRPPLAAFAANWALTLYLGWKQTSWTSVATVAGATAIGSTSSTLGTGAAMTWQYQLTPTPAGVVSGVFTVTGGTAQISYGLTVALRAADYVTRTVAQVTPYMNAVWLKVVDSPYMNRSVTLIDWADNQRAGRVGIFSIHGQLDAVSFQDAASPRTVTMSLWADTVAERMAIELVLSVGSVMLVHVPPTVAFDSGYFAVGTWTYDRPAHLSKRALIKIPVTEVAPPDISIVGNIVTWATLLTNYGTWNDVLNGNATWSAVLALTGNPQDILWSL